MKTKYIAVPLSERLLEKGGTVLTDLGELFFRKERKHFEDNYNPELKHPEYWFEKILDNEEEMLNVLQRILDLNILPAELDNEVISLTLRVQGYNMNLIDIISQKSFEQAQQLINKKNRS